LVVNETEQYVFLRLRFELDAQKSLQLHNTQSSVLAQTISHRRRTHRIEQRVVCPGTIKSTAANISFCPGTFQLEFYYFIIWPCTPNGWRKETVRVDVSCCVNGVSPRFSSDEASSDAAGDDVYVWEGVLRSPLTQIVCTYAQLCPRYVWTVLYCFTATAITLTRSTFKLLLTSLSARTVRRNSPTFATIDKLENVAGVVYLLFFQFKRQTREGPVQLVRLSFTLNYINGHVHTGHSISKLLSRAFFSFVLFSRFITAMHGMQTRSSDKNSVFLSVRQTRALLQNGRKICPDLYTIRTTI